MNVVADAVNRLLLSIVLRCTRDLDETARDYLEVGVLGHGAPGGVGACFSDVLAGRRPVPASELAANYLRIAERAITRPDGGGGVAKTLVRSPVWLEPRAAQAPELAEAIEQAISVAGYWANKHRSSFPPIVVNITADTPDTDAKLAARMLKTLSTENGDVLLYNIHLSTNGPPVVFPSRPEALPHGMAAEFYEMSSELPPPTQRYFGFSGNLAEPVPRGLVFNADRAALDYFLDLSLRLDF